MVGVSVFPGEDLRSGKSEDCYGAKEAVGAFPKKKFTRRNWVLTTCPKQVSDSHPNM